MKGHQSRRGQPRFSTNPLRSDTDGLLKAGTFSLLLHISFIVIFSFSLRSTIPNIGPSVYRVTLRPLLGDGLPKGGSGLPGAPGLSASPPSEKVKPVEKPEIKESKKKGTLPPSKKQISHEAPAKDKTVEGLKRSSKKAEKLEKEKESSKSLEEALGDIRKKAALDKIQKRVARREELEKEPKASSSGSSTGSGSGVVTGTGTGTGLGTGGSPTGSPWGSPFGGSSALESKLNDYYNTIWERIKKEWILLGDSPKGKSALETIIVIVIERDGRIQKSWFEKKSGNSLYDQSAMRAIKKADPLPPIPKEFSDNTFEIGIRFYPD